jgi:hypothetical protein
MSAVTEASRHLHALAAPGMSPGESVKAAIRRGAIRAGIPSGLAKRLWYGEVRRIDADLMDKLRAANKAEVQELEEARGAYRLFAERLAAIEAAIGLSDPNTIGSLDHASSGVAGASDRPLDRKVGRQSVPAAGSLPGRARP